MQTYAHVLPGMQEAAAAAIEPMMRRLLGKLRRRHGLVMSGEPRGAGVRGH
jgi:hypothetical protein